MLSNTCKYAIKAMVYLTLNHKPDIRIGIKNIAKETDIPSPFLSKILQLLAKKGLLISTKGPHGGFALGKDAHDITFLEIVDVFDGQSLFEECIFGLDICNGECNSKSLCPIHPRSGPLREELARLFGEENLGDFADKYHELRK